MRVHMAIEIRTVDFNLPVRNFAGMDFASHCFAQFLRQNESGLLLAAQITRMLQG